MSNVTGKPHDRHGPYVTVPRAAEMLGVSTRTVTRMISDGMLKAFKPRGHWRVSLSSLRKAMAEPVMAEEELEYDPLARR